MRLIESVAALRDAVSGWRGAGGRVALVPTMGNLHAGHLALVETAREHAAHIVVSVFVNPMQFGENEDYGAYPRTLESDQTRLSELGVDVLFAPPVSEVYPAGDAASTRVEVPGLSDILCGASRPGHFVGVSTVVAKLFNMVQPDVAVFGEKDFQQLLVIRRMALDLDMPVEIIGMPTVRESDGLAMSSRNAYLAPDERQRASALYRALCSARDRLLSGEAGFAEVEAQGLQDLAAAGMRPDYFTVRRSADLGVPSHGASGLVVLGAAWLGQARLIDNLRVSS